MNLAAIGLTLLSAVCLGVMAVLLVHSALSVTMMLIELSLSLPLVLLVLALLRSGYCQSRTIGTATASSAKPRHNTIWEERIIRSHIATITDTRGCVMIIRK